MDGLTLRRLTLLGSASILAFAVGYAAFHWVLFAQQIVSSLLF